MLKSISGGAFSTKDSIADLYEAKKKKLDPVGQEDSDIDNDGDSDESDEYLANRRKTIRKAIDKKLMKEAQKKKLDPVGKEDDDIDNDGDSDESDEYLANRRKTIGKAIKNVKLSGKKDEVKIHNPTNEDYDLDEVLDTRDAKKRASARARQAADDAQKDYLSGKTKDPSKWERKSRQFMKFKSKLKKKLVDVDEESIDEIFGLSAKESAAKKQAEFEKKEKAKREKRVRIQKNYDRYGLMAKEERELNESDYPIYHKSYTSAIDAARAYAKKNGYDFDEDSYFTQVSSGQRKPSPGKTNMMRVQLTKNGKPTKKGMQIQVYGMDNGSYELNTYVESFNIQETSASMMKKYRDNEDNNLHAKNLEMLANAFGSPAEKKYASEKAKWETSPTNRDFKIDRAMEKKINSYFNRLTEDVRIDEKNLRLDTRTYKNTYHVLVNGKKMGKEFKKLGDAEDYAADLWDRPKYEDAEILVVDANDYDDILWMNEDVRLNEKSVSQVQQKLMGMAYAYKKGEMDEASPEVKKLADSMTLKQLKDFASTKHEGLPVRKEEYMYEAAPTGSNKIDPEFRYAINNLLDRMADSMASSYRKSPNYAKHKDDFEEIINDWEKHLSYSVLGKYIRIDTKHGVENFIVKDDGGGYKKGDVLRPKSYKGPNLRAGVHGNILDPNYRLPGMMEETIYEESFSGKDFDDLKKGDTITVEFKSSISSNNKRTLKVTAKNIVGKAKIPKVTLKDVEKPKGIKYFLYKRGDKVSFAQGDMAVWIVNYTINEEVELDEALPPHLQKHFDKDGDKVEGKWINGKFVPNKVQPKSKLKSKIRDVTPKGYGPTEDVELDEKVLSQRKRDEMRAGERTVAMGKRYGEDSKEYKDSKQKLYNKVRGHMSPPTKNESVGTSYNEMSDQAALNACKQLSKYGLDASTKFFANGVIKSYAKNKSFTPNQIVGIQNGMRNSGLKMVNESVNNKGYSKINKLIEKRHSDSPSSREYGTDSLVKKYKQATPGQVVESVVQYNSRDPYRIFEAMVHYIVGSSISNIDDLSFEIMERTGQVKISDRRGPFGLISVTDVRNFYENNELTMDDFIEMLEDFGVNEVPFDDYEIGYSKKFNNVTEEYVAEEEDDDDEISDVMKIYLKTLDADAKYSKNGFLTKKD